MKFGYNFGDKCDGQKGDIVNSRTTGDIECDAVSKEYECGGIYHNNYMDRVGSRDHICFWDCSGCRQNQIDKMKGIK